MGGEQEQEGIEIGEAESQEVSINYYGESNIVSISADQVVVSHATGLFTLYFYQMQIPPIQKRDAIFEIKEIPATCVSRVTLTPQLAERFYDVLGTNIKRYKERMVEQQTVAEQHFKEKEE